MDEDATSKQNGSEKVKVSETKRRREEECDEDSVQRVAEAPAKRATTALAHDARGFLAQRLTASAALFGLPNESATAAAAGAAPAARQLRNKQWAADFLMRKSKVQPARASAPTLAQELARYRESKRLFAVFEASCAKRGLRAPPKDGFVRWIFTRKMLEPPQLPNDSQDLFDPIFPSCGDRDAGLEDELLKLRLSADAVALTMNELASESRASVKTVSQLSANTAQLEDQVEVKKIDGKHFDLTFGGLTLQINDVIWDRLQRRYQLQDRSKFGRDVWLLLCRYQSLTGEGYQGAVRKDALKFLFNRYQVKHECFASPLNAYLETFTSAFPDTDGPFGSLGSFFNLRETLRERRQAGGSFEVNPPFVEEIMLATSLYLDMWLQDSEPLSFFIFYPGWSDTPGFEVLKESRFLRKLKYLRKQDHTYLPGYQHLPNREGQAFTYADSFIIVLQNDAGALKWPVDDAGMEELLKYIKH